MKLFTVVVLPLLLFFYSSRICAQISVAKVDTLTIEEVTLDEITVKSPKEQTSIRQLPASISIVTSKLLESSEVNSLKDLSSAIPNFFMPDYGSKLTSPVYIRGIGSRINSPSVGIYVDDVPYFEKAAFDFDFFDIERVEVLRGPQGTLYGRNTMGGIINVFTKSPLTETGSKIKLSAGNYGNYTAGLNHYGKIGKKLGFAVNLSGVHRDGFFTNLYSGDKVDKMNSIGARGRLIWKISDRMSIENVASFERSNQGGYPYALYKDSLKDNLRINYDQYSSYLRNLFSDALVWNYSGAKIKIHATSSFQMLNDNQSIDQDFTPVKQYFVVQEQMHRMLSQEIVMKSNQKKSYEWLVGAYGFVQLFDNSVEVNYYPTKSDYIKGYDHRISGAAFFHQSTLNDFIIPNLSLTAGVRLDLEKDKLNYKYDLLTAGSWVNKTDTIYPSLNGAKVLPKITLNYRAGNSTFYATVANGYKTGGFNSTFERPEDLTFDPESSWNYELGWRAPLFNQRFYADAAIFYIDWTNQQIYQPVPSGRGSMLKNAGETESKGLEFSMRMAPVKGFEANVSYGYTNATFLTYMANKTTDYAGNFIPYVPKQTIAFSGSKTFQFKQSMIESMRISLNYRGTGKYYWSEKNTDYQDYYGLLDGKITFTKGDFQLEFWGKNLFDTQYYAFSFEALGNRYVQPGRPSQVGVNLSLKF
ncbi:MAG: TonB-dependent receptor [Mariniphaga sp.]|nr:TonB-dependent receptor [Mariniphaga sp.]